jgi:hypothetical protein
MHPDVQRYFEEKGDFARPIGEKLREIIMKAAPQLEEGIRWNSPSYKGKGLVCGIGAFKEHVTLFMARGVELPDPDGLFNDGEGNATGRNVRFLSLTEVKVKPLIALIKAAVKLDGEGTKVVRSKRPDLPVPPVLAEALRGDPRARKFFESLPPSAKRDYCEWVGSAKQEATVQRRLEKAMARLGEGRRLGDEYQ